MPGCTGNAFRGRPIAVGLVCGWAALCGGGCHSGGANRPVPAPVALREPKHQADPVMAGAMRGELSSPQPNSSVEAVVTPPAGWRAEPLKSSARHKHQVWISPSGNTAYGVIHFRMPLPVGSALALRHGFLPEMKRAEGEARLISSQRDPALPGLRFVAEGGLYRLRANMMTRGWRGWAVYAGTLRAKEIVPDELERAERAREHTTVGLKR